MGTDVYSDLFLMNTDDKLNLLHCGEICLFVEKLKNDWKWSIKVILKLFHTDRNILD